MKKNIKLFISFEDVSTKIVYDNRAAGSEIVALIVARGANKTGTSPHLNGSHSGMGKFFPSISEACALVSFSLFFLGKKRRRRGGRKSDIRAT